MSYSSLGTIANQFNVNPQILNWQANDAGVSSESDIAQLAQFDQNTLSQNGGSYTALLQSSSVQPMTYDTANSVISNIFSSTGDTNIQAGTAGNILPPIKQGFLPLLNQSSSNVNAPTLPSTPSSSYIEQAVATLKHYSSDILAVIIGLLLLFGAFEIYHK